MLHSPCPCMSASNFGGSLISILLTCLQLRPNFCDAWSNLASAYMLKGRLNEAAQCCRQALALNPLLVNFISFCFTSHFFSETIWAWHSGFSKILILTPQCVIWHTG
jgi:tetratricopeptide (TPR) repeat protein